MTTAAHPVFGTDTLRRGIEADTSAALVSLYADDAELRVVDRHTQPSHPKVLHGRDEIAAVLDDVYSRDMTHTLEACVVQGTTPPTARAAGTRTGRGSSRSRCSPCGTGRSPGR
ncbi:hypothetical protein SHKM778_52970 [Streptomyces sp. KM77-8]|uniref:SnoaL-like domain-containing protein n=1 Tax=Streptomyces haneummycinicus TaxID=3074435 RepID=A0AAT9HMX4_9ACTN